MIGTTRENLTHPTAIQLVIEDLALSEVYLREDIHRLQADIRVSRELLSATLEHLLDRTHERDRLREQLQALRDEYAAFRARVMLAGAAA